MHSRGELVRDGEAADGPDLGPDFWARAVVEESKKTRSVHLKVEADVFDYFFRQGKGHLTRMQNVLKAYVKAHER